MKSQQKPIFKKWWFWVIVVFVLGGIGNTLGGNTADNPIESSAAYRGTLPSQEPSKTPAQTQPPEKSDAPEETIQPTTDPTPEPTHMATPTPESTPAPTTTPEPTPEPTPMQAPTPTPAPSPTASGNGGNSSNGSWGNDKTTNEITGSLSRTAYWTKSGKSYHFSKSCPSLSRSKNILSGTLQDALNAGKKDPCNNCAGGH